MKKALPLGIAREGAKRDKHKGSEESLGKCFPWLAGATRRNAPRVRRWWRRGW